MSLRVLILHVTPHREVEHREGESLTAQPIVNKKNENEALKARQEKEEWLLAVRCYRSVSDSLSKSLPKLLPTSW